ncbi:hypothetical protein TNCV_2042481 [Trichonephila clavipes]|nr:hypothetical protein TNCV_2042481 [Trichonephila clavipes]
MLFTDILYVNLGISNYTPTGSIVMMSPSCLGLGLQLKLKHSGVTAHEGQDSVCPSQYTSPLNAEELELIPRSGGQSEVGPSVCSQASFWY